MTTRTYYAPPPVDITDVAVAVTLPAITPDHYSVLLMRDGTLINRWATTPATRKAKTAQTWIDNHGDTFRQEFTDLLDQQAES